MWFKPETGRHISLLNQFKSSWNISKVPHENQVQFWTGSLFCVDLAFCDMGLVNFLGMSFAVLLLTPVSHSCYWLLCHVASTVHHSLFLFFFCGHFFYLHCLLSKRHHAIHVMYSTAAHHCAPSPWEPRDLSPSTLFPIAPSSPGWGSMLQMSFIYLQDIKVDLMLRKQGKKQESGSVPATDHPSSGTPKVWVQALSHHNVPPLWDTLC